MFLYSEDFITETFFSFLSGKSVFEHTDYEGKGENIRLMDIYNIKGHGRKLEKRKYCSDTAVKFLFADHIHDCRHERAKY